LDENYDELDLLEEEMYEWSEENGKSFI
jgi:hypothetical protein